MTPSVEDMVHGRIAADIDAPATAAPSRIKQNLAAMVILLLTVAALWQFWPGAPRGGARGGAKTLGPVEGHLEAVRHDRIIGWAWDKSRPDTPVDVEISDGVSPPVVVAADKYRMDLEKGGKGNGRHCFVYMAGGRFAPGRSYVIHVKIVGAPGELQQSPQDLAAGGGVTTAPASGR